MQNKYSSPINNTKDKILTCLKRIKMSYNTADISSDDFGISQEDYFKIILPILFKPNEMKTDRDISLIFGYFLYLNEFISTIANLCKGKSMEILQTVAGYLSCEKWEKDRIVVQQGKKGDKYYIILSGECEIIITKSHNETITMKSYLRYLALLIEYEDFELLNRVLNENYDTLPIEISDCGAYGKVFKGVKKEIKKARIMTTSILKQYLIEEDVKLSKDFSSKYNNDNASLVISVEQYISRLYNIKRKINFNNSLIQTDIDDMNRYDLTIYYYDRINTIRTGSQFGNVALNDSKATRNATVITTSTTYFGILNKKTFVISLKKATEKIRKKLLSFVLAIPVFEGYSPRLFTKYSESSFVNNKVNKGDFIIKQKQFNDNIVLIKEGLYKETIQFSIQGIVEIIKYYYSKIKSIHQSKSSVIGNPNINYKQLDDDYTKMLETEGRIVEIIKDNNNDSLKRFYFQVKEVKLWTIIAPYSFGFAELNYINDENLMSIKCVSTYGEYLTLSKVIYNNIRLKNQQIKMNESNYCNMRIVKLLKRLLIIRESQLRVFCNNSDLYCDIYFDTNIIDLICTPKRRNCLPGQVNHLNETKIKRFFSADAQQRKKKKNIEETNMYHQLSLGFGLTNQTNKVIKRNNTNCNSSSINNMQIKEPMSMSMSVKQKNRSYTPVNKSKSIQATSILKQSSDISHMNNNSNRNRKNTPLKLHKFFNRNIRSSSCMINNNTKIGIPYNYKFSDSPLRSSIKEKDLPIHLMKIKTMCLKKLRFFHHKDENKKIKSWIPYSTSIEKYKQIKERNYINTKNHYLIKTTRDIFFRRKDIIQMTIAKSSRDIHHTKLNLY